MDRTIEEWVYAASELLSSGTIIHLPKTHPFPIQNRNIHRFVGENMGTCFVNPFEVMLWISTKSPDNLPFLVCGKDKKNILSEIVQNDNCADILELFLMRGLHVNTTYLHGYPLFFSASPRNLKLLLEYGMDPNIRMRDGMDITQFLLKSVNDYTLTKIEILIPYGLSLFCFFNGETSYDKMEKIYGRYIIENRIKPLLKQYFLLGDTSSYTNYASGEQDEYELFRKIVIEEELYMEYRKGIICELVRTNYQPYNSTIQTEFNRKILLNNHKYAILAYLKNPGQLKVFCDRFIQKRKLRYNFFL